jgi:PAS domain S-box-containing protein
MANHMEGRTPQIAVEFRIAHRDGSHRWALARGLMVRDEDGAPVRLAGSLSDITARHLAEEKLRKQALSDELTGCPTVCCS